MALILLIETATDVCSVTLARDAKPLTVRETSGSKHAEMLTVMIEQIFKEAGISYQEMDAVAVSIGPGSYTGLRIGASVAKGFCYALEKPLIAISTLKAMANEGLRFTVYGLQLDASDFLLCPMIDARRMEVYSAIYDSKLNEVLNVDARIITEDSFKEILNHHKIIFFGSGADKCRPLFESNPNASFANVSASSAGMVTLAEEKFKKKDFEDVSLFEPFYLKEVAIGKKKS